ncbi:MAG: hypothetical protein J5721_00315 [Lachnospiraceae bacterium]|nr:hypothetical protein [Lachnospiraceae bacterium]
MTKRRSRKPAVTTKARDLPPKDLAGKNQLPKNLAPKDLAGKNQLPKNLAPRDLTGKDLAPKERRGGANCAAAGRYLAPWQPCWPWLFS